MRASDFHSTRAEILVRIFVSDDRDQATLRLGANRNFAEHTNDGGIAFVRRMHCYGAVTKHGFRAGRCDGNVIAGFFKRGNAVFIFLDVGIGGGLTTFRIGREGVFKVPHVAVDFDILNLKVRDCSFKMRVPVDETLAAIDQTVFVHLDEDLDDGVVEVAFFAFRCARCAGHSERIAGPIAGGPKPLELFDDGAAGFGFPFPDFLKEFLTAHFSAFRLPGFSKTFFDHQLGCDTRVILARLPKGIVALHAFPAHKDVLQRVVEGVTNMENARHVRRWDHNREGLIAGLVSPGFECV